MRSQSLPPRPHPPKVSFGLARHPGAAPMPPPALQQRPHSAGADAPMLPLGVGSYGGCLRTQPHWSALLAEACQETGSQRPGGAGFATGWGGGAGGFGSAWSSAPPKSASEPTASWTHGAMGALAGVGPAAGVAQAPADPAAYAAAYQRVQSMLNAAHAPPAPAGTGMQAAPDNALVATSPALLRTQHAQGQPFQRVPLQSPALASTGSAGIPDLAGPPQWLQGPTHGLQGRSGADALIAAQRTRSMSGAPAGAAGADASSNGGFSGAGANAGMQAAPAVSHARLNHGHMEAPCTPAVAPGWGPPAGCAPHSMAPPGSSGHSTAQQAGQGAPGACLADRPDGPRDHAVGGTMAVWGQQGASVPSAAAVSSPWCGPSGRSAPPEAPPGAGAMRGWPGSVGCGAGGDGAGGLGGGVQGTRESSPGAGARSSGAQGAAGGGWPGGGDICNLRSALSLSGLPEASRSGSICSRQEPRRADVGSAAQGRIGRNEAHGPFSHAADASGGDCVGGGSECGDVSFSGGVPGRGADGPGPRPCDWDRSGSWREPSFGPCDGAREASLRCDVPVRGGEGSRMPLEIRDSAAGEGVQAPMASSSRGSRGSMGDVPVLMTSASPESFTRPRDSRAHQFGGLLQSHGVSASEGRNASCDSAWKDEVFSGMAMAEAALGGAAGGLHVADGRPPRWAAPQNRGAAAAAARDGSPDGMIRNLSCVDSFASTGLAGGGGGQGGAGLGAPAGAASALQRLACEPVLLGNSFDFRDSGATL